MTFGLSAAAVAGIAAAGTAAATVYSANKGAKAARGAANTAAEAQREASQLGIEESRRQFDLTREDQMAALEQFRAALAPYVSAGQPALAAQQNLIGLGGAEQQQAAIQALQASPQFQALTQQGEQAILQNASATGGLRGGNTQAALAQFRPALLSQLIEQQYGRLGGMTQLGQNSAIGVGTAGLNTASGLGQMGLQTGANIAQLLGQQGAATAGAALAGGRASAMQAAAVPNAIASGLGVFQGLGGFGSRPPNIDRGSVQNNLF